MTRAASIEAARLAAAHYLRADGYSEEARLVETGQGDDFREVRIALSLLRILDAKPAPPTHRGGRRIAGEEC